MRRHRPLRSPRSSASTRARLLLATTAAAATLLSGCAGSEGPGRGGPGEQAQGSTGTTGVPANPDRSGDVALEPFSSCDDLLGWIKQQALPHVTAYGLEGYDESRYAGPGGRLAVEENAGVDRAPGAPSGGAVPTTAAPTTTSQSGSTDRKAAELDAGGGSGGSVDHSGTNNQEKGVDEPDQVKNDGDRLFAVTGNRIVSYADLGSTPVQAGTLTLDYASGGNHQMLLTGTRLLVLSQEGYGYPGPMPYAEEKTVGGGPGGGPGGGRPVGPRTLIQIVDVTDMSNMKVVDRVAVDGTLVSARLANGKMRVVTSAHPASFTFVYPNGRGAEQAAKDANTKIVNDSKIEDWLPRMYSYGPGSGYVSNPPEKQLLPCSAMSRPKEFSGYGVLSVLSIDPSGSVDPASNVGIMGDGDLVYASPSNLYVTTNEVVWGSPRGVPGGNTPTTVVNNGPVANSGPVRCVMGPARELVPRCPGPTSAAYHTAVHQFDLSGGGPALYRASGKFEGALLNQYSMSEHGGVLRAATTSSAAGTNASPGSESQVVALKEKDGRLEVIGRVNGLGTSESIKAVRFVDDVAYVVTFRQTDPLFTVDLRDPTNPRVAGKLDLLGYSAYLHPVGDGYLLGVGQDATATGRTQGTALQLFDVRNPAAPKLVQKLVVPNATSLVENDPHAFLWWARTNLVVIPVSRYDYGGPVPGPIPMPDNCPTCGGGPTTTVVCVTDPCPGGATGAPAYRPAQPFLGVVGFTVTPDGIKEVGSIQHLGRQGGVCGPTADCVEPASPPTTIWCPPGSSCPVPTKPPVTTPVPAYPVQITRTVVAGINLLTLSTAGLKANDIGTFAERTWVPLT